MLRLADDGAHPNITWIHASAETAQLATSYDLVTAGASIHWMDHALLFPKLAGVLAEGGVVAVIEGDGVHDVPWQADWDAFMRRWLERLGGQYDPDAYQEALSAFVAWMTVAGQRAFQAPFTQSIEHFIECQHSRATWSRARLGSERVAAFDAELRELLLPHATDGMLSYTIKTQMVWGIPTHP
jgi:SAM-dependent methyltransferase